MTKKTKPPIDTRLTEIMLELLQDSITLQQIMRAVERKAINVALVKTAKTTRGRMSINVTKAAQMLGVHRNTLHLKLRGWKAQNHGR